MSEPSKPTTDALFPAHVQGAQQLPTTDDLFPASQFNGGSSRPPNEMDFSQYPEVSAATDVIMTHTAVGRILNSFGQGAEQGWGTQPLGLSPEQEQGLRKAGIFNDWNSGNTSFVRTLNEAFWRPAAAAFDFVTRLAMAPVHASQAALAQSGSELQNTAAGRAIGAEQLGQTAAEIVGYEAGGRGDVVLRPGFDIHPQIARARAAAVIGEGEAGYFGTKQPTPESTASRFAAARQEAALQEGSVSETPTSLVQPSGSELAPTSNFPEQPASSPADIHTIARQIAPDTFVAYDALQSRSDTYRRWLGELSDTRDNDPRVHAANTEIENILSKVSGAEDRLTKRQATTVQELRDQIDDIRTRDTSDMATVRADLQKTDYKMRDLAPDVARAYRSAEERMPPAPEVEPVAQPEATASQAPATQAADAPPGEPAGTSATEPTVSVTSGGQPTVAGIARDVQQKLEAVGRPTEEAEATAQIVSAYYETRAARFGGKKGSADELYTRDAPDIVAGKSRAKEPAQGKRGAYVFKKARDTIRIFKSADASTAIHETGHNWLEQLMRDSQEAEAPEALANDAQTVRDWLGTKAGEEIPTKAHEKFARGFERYMMEGVAPSKKLAEVFAKFRDWLTKIYQTVNRLRSPINDDIRAVFDRMLSTAPEKTVIAPDRENIASAADRHEELAEKTPPDQAAPVADAIRADIDVKAAEISPDVAKELERAGPSTKPSAISGANENPPGGGHAAEPVAGEPGGTARTGEVAEGGNDVAEESSLGRDADAAAAAAAAATTDQPKPASAPDDANARFAEPASRYLDKAGNIVLENLNTPEDVNQVLRDTAAKNDNFMHARRGELSLGEQLDLAEAAGLDGRLLDKKELGHAYNAEQIIALRKLLIQSAQRVHSLMKAAVESDDVKSLVAYAEAKARHGLIQERVSAATAEAGRALAAFRNIAGLGGAETKVIGEFLKDATGRTLNQLRQEVRLGATLQSPAQVSRFVNMTKGAKIKAGIIEYYVNALISGPVTHARYAVGNALNAVFGGAVETPLAAAIGSFRSMIGAVKEGDRVYLREAPAQIFALTKGSREGWKAGYEALKSGVSPVLPGERAYEGFSQGAIPGKIGQVIRAPSHAVAGIHSFFKAVRYEQAISAMAVRTAIKEGLEGDAFKNRVSDLTLTPTPEMMSAWEDRESYDELENALSARDIGRSEGLSGDALDSRIRELVKDPTSQMKADLDSGKFTQTARIISENSVASTREALRELYMAPTEYGTAMGWITRAANSSLLFKIMAPFMKIGLQITRNAFIERTPMGFASKEVRENLLGRNGGAVQDMQWAKVTAGTALMGVTYGLAAEGFATGDGPEDPAQRRVWLLTHKPNTIQIGDVTIPYQGLGSFGMLMRFAANTHQVISSLDADTWDKTAIAALEGTTKSVLDENFMRGVKDALDAVYHPDEYGPSYVKQFATNWLPFSVGTSQIARLIDPIQRETKTGDFLSELWNTVKSKEPFLSETLPAKRDMFGEPINIGGNIQNYANDPVVIALDSLQMGIGKLDNKIRGIQLTPEQYDVYAQTAGRLSKIQMNSIVALPGFSALPTEQRIEMLKHAIESSRENARGLLMMQSMGTDNDIMHKAYLAKVSATKP